MLDWDTDVRPVLVAVYEAMKLDAGSQGTHLGPITGHARINEVLGRDPADPNTSVALGALKEGGYLNPEAYGNFEGEWRLVKLSERGLQEVAGWPGKPGEDYGAKLLDLLDARIAEATDEDERTRLERFREAVGSVGKDVVTGVLTDLARRGI